MPKVMPAAMSKARMRKKSKSIRNGERGCGRAGLAASVISGCWLVNLVPLRSYQSAIPGFDAGSPTDTPIIVVSSTQKTWWNGGPKTHYGGVLFPRFRLLILLAHGLHLPRMILRVL